MPIVPKTEFEDRSTASVPALDPNKAPVQERVSEKNLKALLFICLVERHDDEKNIGLFSGGFRTFQVEFRHPALWQIITATQRN